MVESDETIGDARLGPSWEVAKVEQSVQYFLTFCVCQIFTENLPAERLKNKSIQQGAST
jgi:hypothetical protein